ncbi:MSHA biogenesis protein MshI [Pseudomonas sp.]|uniref:type IV pilus biogenesis protein PilM n=1 Tax=Pseudomonas sp. TaxID=306 RepID=UPI0019DBB641|nr:MSHA biogenesis protein MshI [Pseudomonas sp.]MBF0674050.1 MSHA biogenesis protein MshI [Pseudomonas sp.]
MGLLTRKAAQPKGLLGIELSPNGVALAHVQRSPEVTPQLLHCAFREGAHPATLKTLVSEFGLAGRPVNLLLHPADYRIFLLEAPDVPANELRDAMRWRVKDLISEPLDSVVLDCFLLPENAYRGRNRLAYCAALDKSRMQALAAQIRQAGLRLSSIDITEMVFRNLGLLAGAQQGGNVAVLRLRSSEGLVCIQNGEALYLARRLEHGVVHGAQDLASMTLEIQRTLDYFESQLGVGHIGRMLLLPMKHDGDITRHTLAQSLAVNLQALDLRTLFPGQPSADLSEELQAFCMGAVGAALRQDAR